MTMPRVKLTPDDILSTLKHTNVPTIISEGKGDLIVLRKIEDRFAESGLAILAAGGRETVLRVFNRRAELPNNQLFLFFVDRDCWVYAGIPDGHTDENLFYTDGYSIENDMFRDGELIHLMSDAERASFNDELNRFIEWYSVSLDRHLVDDSLPIATAPNLILDSGQNTRDLLNLSPDEMFPGSRAEELTADFDRLIRGKSLFGLLMRQLSAPERLAKYRNYTLLEIGAARSGALFSRIARWVEDRLTSDASILREG